MVKYFSRIPVLAIIAIVVLSIAMPGQASADKGETEMSEARQYFVQLLGTRAGWPNDMTPAEEKIMTEHYYYLKDLIKKKKVLMAGPVFDPIFGLIILSTESEAEAKDIMDKEPSVVAGVHTYEMHEMRASLLVDYQSPERFVNDPAAKAIRKETVVPATIDQVWEAWTTTEGVKTFFSSAAKVELRIGGPFEIYFLTDAPYGQRGSEDCHFLSYLPKKMLSFEWNAPPSFGDLRGIHTYVVLEFEPVGEKQTKVTLSHVGWGKSDEWDKVYDYFDKAWEYVLGNLKKRFEDGPLDWSTSQ